MSQKLRGLQAQRMVARQSPQGLRGLVGQGMDASKRLRVRRLRVAGGGGGGGGDAGGGFGRGAGGGAGGLIEDILDLAPGTYPVSPGAGGAAGTTSTAGLQGGQTTAAPGSTPLIGGGYGAAPFGTGGDGGSGGGGGDTDATSTAGGRGIPGQGADGGQGTSIGSPIGGQGGGPGGPGGSGAAGALPNGYRSDITGVWVIYAEGGPPGLGVDVTSLGAGGKGGNDMTPPTPGRAGGAIYSYVGPQRCLGGDIITTINGVTSHTFTTAGNFIVPN